MIAAALALAATSSALRAVAATPPGRYNIDTQNGTIADTRTGLIWQRTADSNKYTWSSAQTYCSGLGGGYRVPFLKELFTLIDPMRSSPAIDPAFMGQQTDDYWSASPVAGDSTLGWYVEFGYGGGNTRAKTGTAYVRCVK
jgi:hypothetical protein